MSAAISDVRRVRPRNSMRAPGSAAVRGVQELIDELIRAPLVGTSIIPWSCPVVSFGDSTSASLATVGLNPSNREFVDATGAELDGPYRRFHTLSSLGLSDWSHARTRHIGRIWESCVAYFSRNPYDAWFRQLDFLVRDTGASYYGVNAGACHLDLIPYATARKWVQLSQYERMRLLERSGHVLGRLISSSRIDVLVLNGRSVVERFETAADTELATHEMPDWNLRRQSASVRGIAYEGVVNTFGGAKLCREVLVLGYNHNVQSSFGVTTGVRCAIRNWIRNRVKEWRS